jgi:hypothetical protein
MANLTPDIGATPKPAWQSSTIWAGAVQICGGVALVAVGLLLPDQHADLVPVGIGMIGTGAATIRGRLAATRPIEPLLPR